MSHTLLCGLLLQLLHVASDTDLRTYHAAFNQRRFADGACPTVHSQLTVCAAAATAGRLSASFTSELLVANALQMTDDRQHEALAGYHKAALMVPTVRCWVHVDEASD